MLTPDDQSTALTSDDLRKAREVLDNPPPPQYATAEELGWSVGEVIWYLSTFGMLPDDFSVLLDDYLRTKPVGTFPKRPSIQEDLRDAHTR